MNRLQKYGPANRSMAKRTVRARVDGHIVGDEVTFMKDDIYKVTFVPGENPRCPAGLVVESTTESAKGEKVVFYRSLCDDLIVTSQDFVMVYRTPEEIEFDEYRKALVEFQEYRDALIEQGYEEKT